MTNFIIIALPGFIFILNGCTASEIGSFEISIPSRPLEFTQATLDCWCHLNRHDTQTPYTLSWYKDRKEFYRYTHQINKTDDPIEVFDVAGAHVNKLFSDKRFVYLDDISYQSPGIYRCKVTTEGPNPETKFKEKEMKIRFFPSYSNFYHCNSEWFNNKTSLAIACYFVINGTTSIYHTPLDYNWYKDNQLIYSYVVTKEQSEEEDYIFENKDIEHITHPHVPGVFLDSQLTYKNNIVLHHMTNKSTGRYECEITMKRTSTLKPKKLSIGVNVNSDLW